MKYLIDTSALVRILRRQVDQTWHEQVTHGVVAICDPVLTEALTIKGPKIKVSEPHHLAATHRQEGSSVWRQYLDLTELNGVLYIDEGNGGRQKTY